MTTTNRSNVERHEELVSAIREITKVGTPMEQKLTSPVIITGAISLIVAGSSFFWNMQSASSIKAAKHDQSILLIREDIKELKSGFAEIKTELRKDSEDIKESISEITANSFENRMSLERLEKKNQSLEDRLNKLYNTVSRLALESEFVNNMEKQEKPEKDE